MNNCVHDARIHAIWFDTLLQFQYMCLKFNNPRHKIG